MPTVAGRYVPDNHAAALAAGVAGDDTAEAIDDDETEASKPKRATSGKAETAMLDTSGKPSRAKKKK